ncbi:putative signal transducing protein [Lysobacter sp. TAB13]|uniref:putative signal transducing protein n=1 Tax=Lysobacter sp. TAB13 TaxID=3233065 RepID=UPI003F9BD869
MQIVYEAAHPADAQLAREVLAQDGILAYVLDSASGSVRIEVADDDAPRARQLIGQWRGAAAPPAGHEDGALIDRDSGHGAAAAPPDDSDAYQPLRKRKVSDSGYGLPSLMVTLIVGGFIGAGLSEIFAARTQPAPPATQTIETDSNGDGRTDTWTTYVNGVGTQMRSDRNGDGKVDEIVRFENNLPQSNSQDNDFDGDYESQAIYLQDKNRTLTYSIDRDGDGEPDYRVVGPFSIMQSEEWLDSQGRVVKQVRHDALRALDGKFDSDGDGVLDVERTYDERGEIVSTRPLTPR